MTPLSVAIPRFKLSVPFMPVARSFATKAQRYSEASSLEEYCDIKHQNNLTKVRSILSNESDQVQLLKIIDLLQRMAIDYHFKEDIEDILKFHYENIGDMKVDETNNLFNISIQFRLLRQGRYNIPHDVFKRFIDKEGIFDLSLSKDIRGLLSLYDASQLTGGEELLHNTCEFSRKHLISSLSTLDSDSQRFIIHTMEYPCFTTLQRYKARHYLSYCGTNHGLEGFLQQVARFDFNQVQSLHQMELKEIFSWWKNLGLLQELSLIRNEPMKWYLLVMCILPDPLFSRQRIEIAKVVALIYVIDDIFDIYGSPNELCLLAEAIEKWDVSASDKLPKYMRVCYTTLYNITTEISHIVVKESGWDPINSLKKMWMKLFKAFLTESKWFASKYVPTTEEYLKNGIISSGVHIVLVHIFFLLGQDITKETVKKIESIPTLISLPATLLRLWDDLEITNSDIGKDKKQEEFDGSYLDCYINEHPDCSIEAAREKVMNLIFCTSQCLNKECFSDNSFSPYLVDASLNSARIFKVMHSYDQNNLPILEDYKKLLLLKTL